MSQCKSCKAEIVWVKTTAGRNMPCDADLATWPDGTVVTTTGDVLTNGGEGYRPHWATCPHADSHRTKQRTLFDGDV